jgi:hypothetical protein
VEYKYKLYKLLETTSIGLAMATKKTSKTQKAVAPVNLLDIELFTLQNDCDAVESKYAGVRNELYKTIARVYYWWRKADAQKGYLDAKIEQMGGVFKRESKHGYNFSPVLQLVYGNCISDYEISKRGQVLNLLHSEYKKSPKKYGTDVVKLANYINQKNGLTRMVQDSLSVSSVKALEKLVKQQDVACVGIASMPSSVEINVAKQNAVDAVIGEELGEAAMLAELITEYGHDAVFIRKQKPNQNIRLSPAIRQVKLAADAEKYWKKQSGLGLIDADFGFDTDTNNFGLAVVKRDATGVSVIDSFVDSTLIKQALAAAYERQYVALPSSLRCMYETLKTQLLPDHVASNMAGKWDNGNEKKWVWEKHKIEGNVSVQVPVKAMPRFVHTGNANLFILSPIATEVGVCTMVAPNNNVMAKHSHDVFLAPRSKVVLEQLILNAGNMNCYQPAHATPIQHANEPYSHRVQITSIADVSNFYFVDFYPFIASASANYGQAMLDVAYEKKLKIKIKLPRSFVHTVAKNGADKWLAGKGNHANRESNRYIQLTLSSKSLRLDFDYKEGKALAHYEFQLPSTTKLQAAYKQKFVCLDLLPVLSALGALQLTTDVQLLLDSNVAVFKFSTSAGDFVIAVPTCDDKGKRVKSAAFTKYMPNVQPLTIDERMDVALERYYARNPDGLLIDLDFNPPKRKRVYEYE